MTDIEEPLNLEYSNMPPPPPTNIMPPLPPVTTTRDIDDDAYIKDIMNNIISIKDETIYGNNPYVKDLFSKLKNLDITFGYFDLLEESKEFMSLLLSMTSLIPMIDSDRLNDAQAMPNMPTLKELNLNLLNIQKILQVYCIQQYSLLSFSSNIISNLINEFKQDTYKFNELINKINGIKIEELKGGSKTTDTMIVVIFKLLFLMLFVIPNATSFQSDETTVKNLNLYSNENPLILTDKKNLIEFGVKPDDYKVELYENFKRIVSNKVYTTEVPTNKMIAIYDEDIKKQYEGLFGTIQQYLFRDIESGEQIIQQIVIDTNNELINFSTNVTSNCIELMKIASDKGIFKNLKSLDELEFKQEKIDEARQKVKSELDETKQRVLESSSEAISDISQAKLGEGLSKLGKAGAYLWKYLSTNEKQATIEAEQEARIDDDKQSTIDRQLTRTDNTNQIGIQTKVGLDSLLYNDAKLYCSYGYNLQLSYENNILNVIGDKVDYSFLIRLINLLDKNIDYQMAILNNEIKIKVEKNQYESDDHKNTDMSKLNILTSLSQRLNILKTITENIADLINFSIYSHIDKLQRNPTPNTLNKVKEYFDGQINDLNQLLYLLNQYFPFKTQNIRLQEEMAREESILEKRKQDMLDVELRELDETKQREAKRYEFDMESSWNATSTYIKSWINIGTNTIHLSGDAISDMSKELAKSTMKIPVETFDEILTYLLEYGNGLIFKILKNPSGWIAISIPLFTILLYIGQLKNFIKIFTYGGNQMMMIISGGLAFIYQIIPTISGFILNLKNVALYKRNTILPEYPEQLEAANAEAARMEAARMEAERIAQEEAARIAEAEAARIAEAEAARIAEAEAARIAEAEAARIAQERTIEQQKPFAAALAAPLTSFINYPIRSIRQPSGIFQRKLFTRTYNEDELNAVDALIALPQEENEKKLCNLFDLMNLKESPPNPSSSIGGKKYRKTSKNKRKKTKRNVKHNKKNTKRRRL